MENSTIKLIHAKRLLSNFALEYKAFIKANYQLIKEENKNTGDYIVKLRIKNSLPEDWGATLGDIIHNIRASLDLLITDLLIANGKQPTTVSAFPICETKKDFLDNGRKKVGGIKDEAWGLIKKIKPFKESNLKLWQLHKLDIVEKHRLIIPVVSENKAVIIDFGARMKQMFGEEVVGNVPSMSRGIRPAEREAIDGMTLFSADKTFSVPNFEFELVFGQGEVLQGSSISKSLNEFIELAESVIEEFAPLLD